MSCVVREDSRGKPTDGSTGQEHAENKAKITDHIAGKRNVRSCLVHEPVSIQEAVKKLEARVAVNREWQTLEDTSGLRRKESRFQGRSRPSREERWKHSPLRELHGPLSLEERRTCETFQTYNERVVLRRRIQNSIHGARRFSFTAARFLDHIL